MKRQLLTLLAFLPTYFFAQVIPSNIPTNGLVAWYPFNGNANDESGNGNNGIVNGAILTNDRNGNSNSAYYFSSNNCATRIDANINTSSIQTGLTISIWAMRVGNGCIGPRLLEFWPGNNGPGMAQWGWDNSQSIGIGSTTSTGFGCYSGLPLSPSNVWTNLVYANDGNNGYFYKDGVLDTIIASTGNPILASSVAFGRMNHPAYDAFNGNLDDIAVWDRALSPQEISNLYSPTSNPVTCLPSYIPTNGLIGFWPFCGNANDESGNGHNGAVNGASLTSDRFGNTNNAYNFNPSAWSFGSGGHYIYIPYSSVFNSNSITVSAWFQKIPNFFGNPGGRSVIKRFEGGYSNPNGQTWGIYVNDANDSLITFVLPPNTTNNYTTTLSQVGPKVNPLLWEHVVLTFDGISMKTYFNGQLSSTIPANGMQMNANGNSGISIGMSIQANGNWDPFNGSIDDIGIWDRAFSSQEVNNLFNSSSSVGIESNNDIEQFRIFPNPGHEIINVSGIKPGTHQLYLYNSIGKLVKSYFTKESNLEISLEGLPSGIYYLKGNNEDRGVSLIKE